ncbi:hypothetical protein GCM10023321_46400 [Pseudonocardia eucalypti]|uniref:Glyoxalase-like domain-containing protein n=1 Tax=Pseudonocardia eucalypti TaxID=648755 RepID=A0ABP9QGY2_9PSEU
MSSFIFSVTFDCSDPERMAAFWSQVTGYRRLPLNSDDLDDDAVALEAPDHRGVRRMPFFKVPQPKTVTNSALVERGADRTAAEHPVALVRRGGVGTGSVRRRRTRLAVPRGSGQPASDLAA